MYLSIALGGRLLVSCLPMQEQINDEKEGAKTLVFYI